jgi:hypothetical protein
MPEPYSDLIAGTLLCQELLVRHPEECEVLEPGSYRAFLEAHLRNVSEVTTDRRMYGPMRALIAALAKEAPIPRPKH